MPAGCAQATGECGFIPNLGVNAMKFEVVLLDRGQDRRLLYVLLIASVGLSSLAMVCALSSEVWLGSLRELSPWIFHVGLGGVFSNVVLLRFNKSSLILDEQGRVMLVRPDYVGASSVITPSNIERRRGAGVSVLGALVVSELETGKHIIRVPFGRRQHDVLVRIMDTMLPSDSSQAFSDRKHTDALRGQCIRALRRGWICRVLLWEFVFVVALMTVAVMLRYLPP